jgi:hypothetical protein
MKIREGFVSNSSASSFIISKSILTPLQQNLLLHYYEAVTSFKLPFEYVEQLWRVTEEGNNIEGTTWMDNFDMKAYMVYIGVDPKQATWEDPAL